ncbi:MAG TPA: hypothetical protein VE664_02505 [Actinomycetes bacterium]|jgi:hypothetical protein|nr:hypothetical protein [Actinomycetes bacterium]
MTTQPAQPGGERADLTPRDATYWAKHVTTLKLGDVPAEAINLNVTGKRVVGPIQGFGKLWQKTYRVELTGLQATPTEVIATWKRSFGKFWPRSGRFYGPLTGIAPGDVALLNIDVGAGAKLSTGILVLYADEESFTFMTPQGHVFAAWITFSAAQSEPDGVTAAQVQVLLRANDPIYELGMPIAISRREDRFWQQTLTNLARHLGVADPVVTTAAVCVDRRRQWSNMRNVWHNAGVRTALYTLGTPLRALRRSPGGGQEAPRERR